MLASQSVCTRYVRFSRPPRTPPAFHSAPCLARSLYFALKSAANLAARHISPFLFASSLTLTPSPSVFLRLHHRTGPSGCCWRVRARVSWTVDRISRKVTPTGAHRWSYWLQVVFLHSISTVSPSFCFARALCQIVLPPLGRRRCDLPSSPRWLEVVRGG